MIDIEKLRFCAKYPFTNEAKHLLIELNINLQTVPSELIEYSINRMNQLLAADAAFFRDLLNQIRVSKEGFLRNELLSYPISKILVSLCGGRIKREYAKAEAERVYYFLQFDKTAEKIAEEIFSLKENRIPLAKFLEFSKELRLTDYEVVDGAVLADYAALSKLISQYVFKSIMETNVDKKTLPKMFLFFADELEQAKPAFKIDTGPVESRFFPPCMKKIISELQSGEKVSHIPRFVLSTFLANANMLLGEAVNIFRSQPNFNEKKTFYYLEHTYGTKSGKKYSVPACSKMETYGLCTRDSTCRWKSPITYYAKMKAKR
jgi:DNA primase large subunit